MRDKSEQKFKARVRELTERHRNLDCRVIGELNQVIRGTKRAGEFAKTERGRGRIPTSDT
jgi:hypothetical protein